jgi:steroid delta-isomerase-like uncharacterized protein
MKGTETVQRYWEEVWNAHDPEAVDRFVVDDVVVETGGKKISGRDALKDWIRECLDEVNDLNVDTMETFQSEDGTRVTSRWVMTGTNNGLLGTDRDQQPIAMTGTAVWAVGDDGKLVRNWVEQASWEQYRRLLRK